MLITHPVTQIPTLDGQLSKSARLCVSLLGGFSVLYDGQPAVAFGYDKVRSLLAFLVVEADHPHRRERLAALFWPDQNRAGALQSLSQALYQLRRAIRDRDANPAFLLVTPQTVQFNLSSEYWLDAHDLLALMAACETHQHARLHTCPECLARLKMVDALYRGDFLAGFSLPDSPEFDEWTLIQREHFHRVATEALRSLCSAYDRGPYYDVALAYAQHWLALDPWQEEAHRQVMQTLAARGERGAALAQFETCRRIFASELGVEPSAETVALYLQIRDDHEQPAHGAHHLLPTPLTPLIGRAQELAVVEQTLLEPDCRLLSLVGSGGIGKTRLALEAAGHVTDFFQNGVFWVALGAVDAVPALVPAIARALGFVFAPHEDARRQLQDFLRSKQMLLVLDNFEHLLDGVPLLAELLAAAPELKILITSRTRLNAQGEHVFVVEGLALPPALDVSSPAMTPAAAPTIAAADAVALFLYHARRVRAGYSPSPGDLAAIVRICRIVSGMPLAILLAAAWMDTLAPDTIAAQIADQVQDGVGNGVEFLAADWADLPERQRSMRTVLDHSWALLTESEQQVLAAVTVFRGGFTHVAAQAVAQATLRQLRALVEKSWLRRATEHRYDLHPLLRQYGEEQLRRSPARLFEAQERHCAFFAAGLERWAGDLRSDRQLDALAELDAEIDNARTAWNWAVQHTDFVRMEQALDGICLYFDWRGRYQAGEAMCRDAIAQVRRHGGVVDYTVAHLLVWQARYSRMLGVQATASAALSESLALLGPLNARQVDPLGVRAFALHEQACLLVGTNHLQAEGLCAQSLALYRAANDRGGIARVLNSLGDLAYGSSAYATGLKMLEEALAIGRALGDRRTIAESLRKSGVIQATLGEIETADHLHRESVTICAEIGDQWGIAEGTVELASVLMYSGRFSEAAGPYQEAADLYQALGSRGGYAMAIHLLGWANSNLGNYAGARSHYLAAEAIWRAEGEQHGLGLTYLGIGGDELAVGDYARAYTDLAECVVLFGAVQQRDEEAIALGMLAAACHGLGRDEEARGCVKRSLQVVQSIGAFAPLHFALEAYALMLADDGEPARALALYTFNAQHPYVQNSRWHEDCYGRHIRACAAQLSQADFDAACARGLASDLHTVVADVMADLDGVEPAVLPRSLRE